ncbi:MAG: Spc7-domain-containing protein [Amphiamblys sp. WSBS2006]|nr:MAG: Spc7-domain-containing protein [Amphiamblys sp. WSBS2006]
MKQKKETKENMCKNPSPLSEKAGRPERRVSFKDTVQVRHCKLSDDSSIEDTPKTSAQTVHENPFDSTKEEPHVQQKRKAPEQPGRSEKKVEMEMTVNVGKIHDEEKYSFVEESSPMIIAKERPSRPSWFLQPGEMALTENVGKVLGKNQDTDTEEIPFIKDFPVPQLSHIGSPEERTETPRKERRRSSLRLSGSSRLDCYPTPLFPRTRNSLSQTVKAPSPCIEESVPEGSLKDFLDEIGVRFLDGLAIFTRRDTLLFERMGEEQTPQERLRMATVAATEQSVFAEGCSEILKRISATRAVVADLEGEFNFNAPQISKRYRSSGETAREEIRASLKSLKIAARTEARKVWYVWRRTFHCQLYQEKFAALLGWAGQCLGQINEKAKDIETCEEHTTRLHDETKAELRERRRRIEAYHTMDWSRYRELESAVERQKKQIAELEKQVAEKENKKTEAENTFLRLEQKAEGLEEAVKELAENSKHSPEPLGELVEKYNRNYNLLVDLCGWRIVSLKKNKISVLVLGDIPLALTIGFDGELLCQSVEIASEHEDRFTDKCIAILKKEKYSKMSLEKTLQLVLKKLEGWSELRKDLRRVRFLSSLSDRNDPEKHIYSATVLNDKTKTRIDVLFDATEYPTINILSSDVVYGKRIEEDTIHALQKTTERQEPNSYALLSTLIVLLSSLQ